MVFFEAFLGPDLLLVGNVSFMSNFALFWLSIVIEVLEFDPFKQVNSHVPSYSSSNAKGALESDLGERFRQYSHVVIGSFYELARFYRYPQRSSLSLEVKMTRSLAWTTDEIMHYSIRTSLRPRHEIPSSHPDFDKFHMDDTRSIGHLVGY